MSARIKKERGITLIALVVTIIILLILAGISIQMLLGDQGLIKKAVEAAERTEIADYEEQLELLGVEIAMDEAAGGTGGSYTDKYQDKIEENFPDAQVTPKDDDSLIVETEEGHIYEVTDEGTDYLGERGDEGLEELPDGITEQDLEISIAPEDGTWAQEVKVTIKIADTKEDLQKFKIKYSEGDEAIWHEYKKPFTVKKTEKISAKIVNTLGDEAAVTTEKQIENIDTVAPGEITISTTPSETNTVITATVTDGTETEDSGQSGIKQISFKKDGETWNDVSVTNEDPSVQATGTYTFEGLTEAEDYTIEVKAIDKAGNEKEGTVTNKANKIPDLSTASEEEIKIECSPAPPEWSNTSVHVTLSGTYTSDGNYTLEYKINYDPENDQGNGWTDYNDEGFDVTQNGKIGIRLKSGEQHGKAKAYDITNIDTGKPTVKIDSVEPTTSTIKVNATATDQAADDTSGQSKIKEIDFYYSENYTTPDQATWEEGTTISAQGVEQATFTTEATIEGLTQEKTYGIKVVAKDHAGNEAEAIYSSSVNTTKIPGANTDKESGNIIITYAPDTWTPGSVNVTLAKGAGVSEEFSIQYVTKPEGEVKVPDEAEWQDYTDSPITVSKNGTTIYVRLWDGTNGGECATGTVANIDKNEPTSVSLEQKAETTPTDTTIDVTVKATDAEKVEGDSGVSGIAKFVFSYKEKDGVGDFIIPEDGTIIVEKKESPEIEQEVTEEYQYKGLTAGKTYTLKVEAYDQANNVAESEELQVTTKLSQPSAPESGTSCVGAYADIDDDGQVDGIVYADMSVTVNERWNPSGNISYDSNGEFSYSKQSGKLKEYYVKQREYTSDFGTGDVLAPKSDTSGTFRFYVMALDDVNEYTHCWYYSAYKTLITGYSSIAPSGFGNGRKNTVTMLDEWSRRCIWFYKW